MASQTPPTMPPQMPMRPYPPARRRSLAGPLVLIIIGVIFLLGNLHLVIWPTLRSHFAHFWPLLLILWGVVRLAEYYSDRQHGYATRTVGAGGVLFLIFLIIAGLSVSQADRHWQDIQSNIQLDDDDVFGGMFGQNYTFTATAQQDLTVNNGSLRVLNDRGDVTVNSWDENHVKVEATKKIRASSQEDAAKMDGQTNPTISIDGNVITVNANTTGAGNNGVESNLEIWVPKSVSADVATRHGDVSVKDRAAYVKASTSKGDISVEDVTGNVDIEQRKGDVHAVRVTGDVSINGQVSDTTVEQISGALKLTGDFFGDMSLSKVTKGVTFRSSRTDMELARLDGDLRMESGDLRASNLFGPTRILTKSKDIHLDDLNGDLRIENSNGTVEVHSTKLGTIEIENHKGDVQVVVPEKSSFQAEFRTRNGDISSDFGAVKISSENNDSNASGTVGSGGTKLQINNEHGNIEIRKAGQS